MRREGGSKWTYMCVCVCSARAIRVDSAFVLCVNRLEK